MLSPSPHVSVTFPSSSAAHSSWARSGTPKRSASLSTSDDVVPVVVGEQDVRDLGALAIDALEQRIGDAVRVDEHALAAGLVDDEVGV